ncbi:MAG TPA: SIS domain-containing protein [Nitrolancea sp.]|nr:SIS domain-containing protein [Nitrolancea sp.]
MAAISQLEREIYQQPEAIERLLRDGRTAVEAVARQIRTAAPRSVLIAARGTSDNAARYATYLFGAHNRLNTGLAAPSLFTIYHAPPDLSDTLVVGISQSGQSPDIVAVLDEANRQGALTVAITNDPASPLAQTAAHTLEIRAGEERAIAATKTYTAELVTLAMLSAALEESADRWRSLAELPQLLDDTLHLNQHVATIAEQLRTAEQFVVIGRGFNYSTAFEIALKIEETCYVLAEPYSSADFRHGPIALLHSGFPVILIAPSGALDQDVDALLDLLSERAAEVIAISDRQAVIDQANAAFPLSSGVPEWLSPVIAVVPGQLLALASARARGIDPDHPRGLSKVTRTN